MSRRVFPVILLCTIAALAAMLLWPRPGPASASGGVAAISAGSAHTCALTTTGGVKCWGLNQYGQLGDATNTGPELCQVVFACSTIPVDVSGLTLGVAAVSAGGSHTCALTTTGGVKCWGSNQYGQLGDGQVCGLSCSTPVDVTGLTSGVAAVSAGFDDHTCAVTTAGGVTCWGRNTYGQLGDGTTADSATPVGVPSLTGGVAAVSAGYDYTCARTTTGGVKCWGSNFTGQLGGLACGFSCTTPADVTGLTSGVAAITAGDYHNCARTTAGGLKCWGANIAGQLGDAQACGIGCQIAIGVPGLGSGVAAVSAGGEHTCAISTTGGLKCWGRNEWGQLGNGTNTGPQVCIGFACNTSPMGVSGLSSGVAAVDAGVLHTCAITTGGGVKCWGNNQYGQLGDGTSNGPQVCSGYGTGTGGGACSKAPVDVSGLAPKPTPTPTACPNGKVPQGGLYGGCGTPTATPCPQGKVPTGDFYYPCSTPSPTPTPVTPTATNTPPVGAVTAAPGVTPGSVGGVSFAPPGGGSGGPDAGLMTAAIASGVAVALGLGGGAAWNVRRRQLR